MNEPIIRRRRKRRQIDSFEIDTPPTVPTENSPPSSADTETKSDNTPLTVLKQLVKAK
jgi:hypothetical protein